MSREIFSVFHPTNLRKNMFRNLTNLNITSNVLKSGMILGIDFNKNAAKPCHYFWLTSLFKNYPHGGIRRGVPPDSLSLLHLREKIPAGCPLDIYLLQDKAST